MIGPAKFGIILEKIGGEIDLKLTRRADLAADRLLRTNGREFAVIETNSSELARKLRRVLERVFVSSGAGGLMSAAQATDAITRCRRMGFIVHTAETLQRRKPIRSTHTTVVETRRVPDPSMSPAELLEQIKRWPDAKWVGYVRADVSLAELIGGLSRIRGRTEAQTKAAAEFRNAAEQAQLGGAKAIDYGAVRVDTSGISASAVADNGAVARAKYKQALDALDRVAPGRAALAERVIIHGQTISELAPQVGFGKGGRGRDRLTKVVLGIADDLSVIFGTTGERRGRARLEAWDDGSRARILDEVSQFQTETLPEDEPT